jgi:hypothetical protein
MELLYRETFLRDKQLNHLSSEICCQRRLIVYPVTQSEVHRKMQLCFDKIAVMRSSGLSVLSATEVLLISFFGDTKGINRHILLP